MKTSSYVRFAEALLFAHGPKAEAEAALQAIICEKCGDMETAQTWRDVQSALKFAGIKKAA